MNAGFSRENPVYLAVCEILGDAPAFGRLAEGCSHEWYLIVGADEFGRAIPYLSFHGYTLISLFAVDGPVCGMKRDDWVATTPGSAGPVSLLYVFEHKGQILILVCEATHGLAVSVATLFPSASWPEREIHDGFGIEFESAYDTRRLFLHETYPDDFHPLKKSVPNTPVTQKPAVKPQDEYVFRKVSGEGVYQIPVGPVHAGIIEPGHFRFSVIGETIFHLEVRLFYTHRGIEKLAEGKSPTECVKVAEAVSGDESVANATAFCMAVERIVGAEVPVRARQIRTILLEIERICSHLGDLSGMLTDVAFPLGASQFAVLRERFFQENDLLSGSRFLRGMICPGGVTRDIDDGAVRELREFLSEMKMQFKVGLKIAITTPSVIDRFSTTGVIARDLLRPLNITGPAARASGGTADVRVTHPYCCYDRFVPRVACRREGDVLARFNVKADEITESLDLIERVVQELSPGPVRADLLSRDGSTLALVESARGENFCWVALENNMVTRYKVRTASYCNWLALEHAVPGNIVADFPVINKSLNLSYAGTDL
ncbi:MAG: NADH-quinone oxidoreductase subunit C [Methanoregula sp.]|jgi:Ni,Fe-hydrogenase III large subunit/NADH:ubiquinone oxidoreductase subunit C